VPKMKNEKPQWTPLPKNTKAKVGEFVSLEGTLELEQIIQQTELGPVPRIAGIARREHGAANYTNVQHDLESLNGCRVRVKIEILEVPKRGVVMEKVEAAEP
jgi:hypothetical protein